MSRKTFDPVVRDILKMRPCRAGTAWLALTNDTLWDKCPRAEYMLWWLVQRRYRVSSIALRLFCEKAAEPYADIVPSRADQAGVLAKLAARMNREKSRRNALVAACGVSQAMTAIMAVAAFPTSVEGVDAIMDAEQLRQADILRGLITDPYAVSMKAE